MELLCGATVWTYCVDLLCGPTVWTYCVALMRDATMWLLHRRLMSTLCTYIEEPDARRPMSKLHVYIQEGLKESTQTNEHTVYMQEELEARKPMSTLCTGKKRLKQGDR